MMNTKDLSWHLFETTGSVEAYLSYASENKIDEKKEANAVGNSPDRGDNNQRG